MDTLDRDRTLRRGGATYTWSAGTSLSTIPDDVREELGLNPSKKTTKTKKTKG